MRSKMLAAGACGFTLIELMIVVGIFAGVSMAGYTVYSVQQRSYLMQEQLVDMQQNVRAFLFFVEKDLRMAGYDVLKLNSTTVGGFSTAKPHELVYSADIGRPRSEAFNCQGAGCDSLPDGSIISSPRTDGSVIETVRYALSSKSGAPAANQYGQVPVGRTTAVTKTFNGTTSDKEQDVVEGVEALEFLYNMSDGTSTTDVAAAGQDMTEIRSVTVSVLMRTRNIVQGYRNMNKCYYPASSSSTELNRKANDNCEGENPKWGAFNDAYRRSLVITNIQCRNMSLQNQN